MIETYLRIMNHPLLWVFVGLTVVFYLITWMIGLNQSSPNFSTVRWLKKHYVAVIFGLGLPVIAGAFHFYLFDAGRAVAAIADELVKRSLDLNEGDGDADGILQLAQGMALLLGAMVAAATIPFTMLRTWINERTATATEQGLITDRINKAVEGLGATKEVTRHRKNKQGVLLFEDGENGIDPKKPIFETVTIPNMEVRIGAIYALERISQDSERDHIQVMEILS